MKRRDFLKLSAGTVTGLSISGCASNILSSNRPRPNVLFIMSDDHAAQAISAYNGIFAKVAPTPNIDRIAKEGMLFENCFCTNSICTPSRAAIFTGKYSHKNGVYKFTALDQSQPTLPKMMKAAGYHTAIVGKYHLWSAPRGFDYFSILPGQGRYHNPQFREMGTSELKKYKGHSSDVIADKALDYLKNRRDKSKPFMFFCQFKAPHDRWEYAKRYEDYLADVEIPAPANLFDDYSGRSDALKKTTQRIGVKHTRYKKQTEGLGLDGKELKKKQYQIYMKKYLRCVKGVDDNVGRILDYLDESGLAKNTIVIYTADQGFFLGEHGLYDKRFFYEESLRMPFLVRQPDVVKAGSVNEDIVLNVDFAPTILEVAGVKADEQMQGKSFASMLKGKTPADWRKSMYYRYYFSHFETEPHYGIRTLTHKLIYFDRIKQWELYDLEKDPAEMKNVYSATAYAEIVKYLKGQLRQLQEKLQDDVNDIGDKPRTGER